ncbi:hypothetical protein [Candidatus Lokiarchaeum ossiferum]|uniref:hypothetical protein n=1 Tax=Candidatus Lokiarchaeum ossiferum TaxID=2951803 RepID=UPI00352C8A1E
MDSTKYNEDLWDEIPAYAFMALGRRGREEISLTQCFIPNCSCNGDDKLHPLVKKMETIPASDQKFSIQKSKYLIHCDCCNQQFHLVFEKHLSNEPKKEELNEEAILLERVYASDADDQVDYGEIGFVQPK